MTAERAPASWLEGLYGDFLAVQERAAVERFRAGLYRVGPAVFQATERPAAVADGAVDVGCCALCAAALVGGRCPDCEVW